MGDAWCEKKGLGKEWKQFEQDLKDLKDLRIKNKDCMPHAGMKKGMKKGNIQKN